MRLLLVFIAILACIALAYGADCSATVSAVSRGNPWAENGEYRVVYDITVRNNGDFPLSSILLQFTNPSKIESAWGISAANSPRGGYTVLLYGNTLAPRASTSNIGVVYSIASADVPALPISVFSTNCPNQPTIRPTLAPTSTPTTKAPTAAPTSAPTTRPPTFAPTVTSVPTTRPQFPVDTRCNASFYTYKTHEWVQDGVPAAAWVIRVTNGGPCELGRPHSYYSTDGVEVTKWNLPITGSVRGGYWIDGFDILEPGQSYEGAGLILVNATYLNITYLTRIGTYCPCWS